jgi:hypothetical protein
MTESLTPDERALLTQLLAPRVRVLSDLLAAQVAGLPAGCCDWADTADDLAVARGLLVKVQR